jgi:hypothetical protein
MHDAQYILNYPQCKALNLICFGDYTVEGFYWVITSVVTSPNADVWQAVSYENLRGVCSTLSRAINRVN